MRTMLSTQKTKKPIPLLTSPLLSWPRPGKKNEPRTARPGFRAETRSLEVTTATGGARLGDEYGLGGGGAASGPSRP